MRSPVAWLPGKCHRTLTMKKLMLIMVAVAGRA